LTIKQKSAISDNFILVLKSESTITYTQSENMNKIIKWANLTSRPA